MENQEIQTSGQEIEAFIQILKKKYPSFARMSSRDCIRPYSKTFPELFMVADNEDYDYEFILNKSSEVRFLRGLSVRHCMDSGFVMPTSIFQHLTQYIYEHGPYPGTAIKDAVENDYYGYILKWGVHPKDMNTPIHEGRYSVSSLENSDAKSLTRLCHGRYPEHAVF